MTAGGVVELVAPGQDDTARLGFGGEVVPGQNFVLESGEGFRSPEALVALAMLDLGGMCPPLPGRAAT